MIVLLLTVGVWLWSGSGEAMTGTSTLEATAVSDGSGDAVDVELSTKDDLGARVLLSPSLRAQVAAPGELMDGSPFHGVVVSWDGVEGDVASFEVHRRAAVEEAEYEKIGVSDGSDTTFYDPLSGLTPGVAYHYRIWTVSSEGVASHWGSELDYAVVTVPGLTDLQASVSEDSESIIVSWDEPVGDVVSYEVYRSDSAQSNGYAKIGEPTSASYSDLSAGMFPGSVYYYRVKAVSAAGVVGGWGTDKNYARVVVPAAEEQSGPPGVPRKLVVRLKTEPGGGVELTWKPVKGNVTYQVYRRVGRSGTEYELIGTSEETSYVDDYRQLTRGTRYLYFVRAMSGSLVSGPSNVFGIELPKKDLSTRMLLSPSLRAQVAAPGELMDGSPFHGVVVSWDGVEGDVASFEVHRRAAVDETEYEKIGVSDGSDTTFYDPLSGLTPGVLYSYRLWTVSSEGVASHWGNEFDYAVVRVPGLTGLQASVSEDSESIIVSWDEPVGDVVSYVVHRRAAVKGQVYTVIGLTTMTSYPDLSADMVPGSVYYYRVQAVSAAGVVGNAGVFSDWRVYNDYAKVVVPGLEEQSGPPGVPRKLVVRLKMRTAGGVELTWKPVKGDVIYNVYRRVGRSGTEYELIGTSEETSYVDDYRQLTRGTRYLYFVRAMSGSLVSGPSNVFGIELPKKDLSTRMLLSPSLRAAIAAPGELMDGSPFHGVVVSWDGVEGDVASFEVHRRAAVDEAEYEKIGVSDGSDTTFYDPLSGLTPGVLYSYRLWTVSSEGVASHWGNEFDYAVVRVPGLTGLQASVSEDSESIIVSWDEPVGDVVSYVVHRRAAVKGQVYTVIGLTTMTSYPDLSADMVPGSVYYYRVQAVSAAGVVGNAGVFSDWRVYNDYAKVVVPADEEQSGPPGVPQNLLGRLKTEPGGGVELTWTPVKGNVTYQVYRRVSRSGTEYELIGTSKGTSYVDLHSSLPPGFRYQYIVRAASGVLVSERSNDFQINIVTFRDLHTEVSGDGYWVDLSWKLDPPSTNVDIQHFEILRREASETSYVTVGRVACCSYRERIGRGPLPGMEYVYRVRPINRYGLVGSWGSSSDYAVVRVPTTKPQARMADPGTLVDSIPFHGVRLSWDDVKGGVTHFTVHRRAAVAGQQYGWIMTNFASDTTYYDPLISLTPGVEYYYRVKTVSHSRDEGHWGSGSNYAAVRVPALTGLQAEVSPDSASIMVSWAETVGDVARYEVYRRVAASGHAYTKIGDATTASYSDPSAGVVPGAEYYYRVKAVSTAGAVGSWGLGRNYAGVVSPAVGNLQAVAASGGVSVSWEQSAGDTVRYEVYRRVAVRGQAYAKIAETATASYLDQSTDLVAGTEYYYRVKPVGTNGVVGGWGPGANYASIKYR